jgi:hypothetical protein
LGSGERRRFTSGSAEHFQQRAELPALRNSSLRPLAVAILAIPIARGAATTACAAVQPAAKPEVTALQQQWPVHLKIADITSTVDGKALGADGRLV